MLGGGFRRKCRGPPSPHGGPPERLLFTAYRFFEEDLCVSRTAPIM